MSGKDNLHKTIDWLTVIYVTVLIAMGWFSIYGASYDFEYEGSIFSFDQRTGKQIVWIITSFSLGGMILLLDHRIFNYFAWFIYGFVILILIFTLVAPSSIVPDIKGSHSWIVIGPVSFQPAELAKIATALVLAKFMGKYNFKLKGWRDMVIPVLIILLPFLLIIMQKETGSALVFVAFMFMLYREGMSGLILVLFAITIFLFVLVIKFSIVPIFNGSGTLGFIIVMGLIQLFQFLYAFLYTRNRKASFWFLGLIAFLYLTAYIFSLFFNINLDIYIMAVTLIGTVFWIIVELKYRFRKYPLVILISIFAILFSFGADYIFNQIMEPHQQGRIEVLLGMKDDLTGAGYNVNQSKIAIGSGGLWGKGFLNGTQTKLKYVPEQDTDFIFCTIGEEHGFWGSTLVVFIYWLLIMRIITIAERQRENFHRIYAYSVASIFFFHLMINIGMVIGIMPVIGIPLPFFSYGGSSLWGFTILLFILLRMDASRLERG